MPTRDDSLADIVSVYELYDPDRVKPFAPVCVAVRACDEDAFKAEYPTALAVMIPPCILYRVS